MAEHTGYFRRVAAMSPTSLWINNVTPHEAALAIDAGATGCTQNPSYADKMLRHAEGKDAAYRALDGIPRDEPDNDAAQERLQTVLVAQVAEVFRPLFESSGGQVGYVTIQSDPFHEDADTIVNAARVHCAQAPNIMAKIPAIPAGFDAMRVLLREGKPILATEVMSVAQALDCARLYDEVSAELDTPPVMYFAHIPGIFDEYITSVVARDGIDIPADYVWQAGVSVAKKIDALMRERRHAIKACSGGARGLHHFTEMVGAACAVTINYAGCADKLIEQDPPVVQNFLRPTPASVLDALTTIPDFRSAYETDGLTPDEYEGFGPVCLFRGNFETAWTHANTLIAERRAAPWR